MTKEQCAKFPHSTPGQSQLANFCESCNLDCDFKSDYIINPADYDANPLDALFKQYTTPIIRSFKDDKQWQREQ